MPSNLLDQETVEQIPATTVDSLVFQGLVLTFSQHRLKSYGARWKCSCGATVSASTLKQARLAIPGACHLPAADLARTLHLSGTLTEQFAQNLDALWDSSAMNNLPDPAQEVINSLMHNDPTRAKEALGTLPEEGTHAQ